MATPASAVAPRRLRRDAEENRRRILQAARELFAQHGLDVTLEDVARHAGLGIGTFYRRFRNRDELLDELFEESLARLEQIYLDALACEDPWSGLVQYLEQLVEMMGEDRWLWFLAIRGSSKDRHLADGGEQFWQHMPELLGRAQRTGQLRADIGPADISVIHATISASLDFTGEQASGAARRYLGIVLDGLRASAATPLSDRPLTITELSDAMSRWWRLNS